MALAPPRFEQSGELHVAGIARAYARDKLDAIPQQWNVLITQLQFIVGRVGNHTYGVWYDVLKNAGPMLYVTGVHVGDFAPVNPGLSHYVIPAQRYAVFRHEGHVSEIRKTVDAVFSQWLPSSGQTHYRKSPAAPDFLERYTEAPEGGKVGSVEILLPVGP